MPAALIARPWPRRGRPPARCHLGRGALLEEDRAVAQHRRDVQRLLDDDDRHPIGVERLDRVEQRFDDDRREPE
jgi:hypothetical protein